MDEPLSNLDAALSRRLRGEILRLHAEVGFTLVYVTHGREEAQEIGARISSWVKAEHCSGPFFRAPRSAGRGWSGPCQSLRSGLTFAPGT